jgi:hypothetical protein
MKSNSSVKRQNKELVKHKQWIEILALEAERAIGHLNITEQEYIKHLAKRNINP